MERRVRGKAKRTAGPQTVSLYRLLICLALFLAVFLGRGVFPLRTQEWREQLFQVIRQDTDFSAAFGGLGRAVAEQAPVLETLDRVLVELAGGPAQVVRTPGGRTAVPLRSRSQVPWQKPWLLPAPEPEPEPVLTAAQRELGLADSVTPVMGVLTSGYGMRRHPISGEDHMHEGVDLAADEGTAVLAFADGVVDYIGESPAYGLYLQLRHDNGVTTFYAHCSELCVQKGNRVKMGDTVARVGDTGNSTGPHLHLELKQNGVFLDPLPYLEYRTA